MSNRNQSFSPVVKIQYGSIANGYADIARYLGQLPQNVYFMHSLVTNPLDPHDMKMCATDDLDIRAAQYSLSLSGAGSNAYHLPVDPYHYDYIKTYIAQGNLIEVTPVGPSRLHPDGSIPAALLQRSLEPAVDQSSQFIANSYVTKELEQLVGHKGMRTLMSADHYLKFLSKAYVHEIAAEAELSVTPGIVFDTAPCLVQFREAVGDVCQKYGAQNSNMWIKAASLSGGQGIYKINAMSAAETEKSFAGIAAGYRDAGFMQSHSIDHEQPFQDMKYFMPIVAEIDIASLPHIKSIAINSGVQAVIGHDTITMTGTTLQKTIGGEYVGGIMPGAADRDAVDVAEHEAVKFFKHAHKDGYRGYGGVDVIVAKTDADELVPFLLEFNPRLTGSTPLLRLVHHTIANTGQGFGQISSLTLPEKNGSVRDIYEQVIGNDLYKAAETGFTGVIPTMIDIVPGRPTGFRLVTIGHDENDMQEKFERVQNNIKRLSL